MTVCQVNSRLAALPRSLTAAFIRNQIKLSASKEMQTPAGENEMDRLETASKSSKIIGKLKESHFTGISKCKSRKFHYRHDLWIFSAWIPDVMKLPPPDGTGDSVVWHLHAMLAFHFSRKMAKEAAMGVSSSSSSGSGKTSQPFFVCSPVRTLVPVVVVDKHELQFIQCISLHSRRCVPITWFVCH